MQKLRNGINVIFSACVSLVIIPLYTYLIELKVNSIFAVSILLLFTSCFSLINHYILPSILYRYRYIRLWVDPLSRYEGYFIHYIYPENSNDKRACGIVGFHYDKGENMYLFSGENYDINGHLISFFQVRDIQYDANINGFRYWGNVKEYENASFSCYGELSFVENGEKLINSANGLFINNCKELVRAKYSTERIQAQTKKPYVLPVELNNAKARGLFASAKAKSIVF